MTRQYQEAIAPTDLPARRPRRLRARLALAALKPHADLTRLSRRYGVSRDEILAWRREMRAGVLRWWRCHRRGL